MEYQDNQGFHVAGYKANTQKSVALMYLNNKLIEKEIKETTLFTAAQKIPTNQSNELSKRLLY